MSDHKVKLIRPHTHAGKEYQPCDEVTLDDQGQVEWLVSIGVAEQLPAETQITEEGK